MNKSKVRKEFLVRTIRERLKAPIPSTETLGYSVMRSFAVDLLALLDECKGVLEDYQSFSSDCTCDICHGLPARNRDLVERIGG
jgi:hypothetical protein